jgi:MFS family permease
MIVATPLTEWLVRRFGHRIACLVGALLLAAGLGMMAWSVQQDYLAVAISMVVMTIGLRTVMTICAVALVDAMPENRTSMGAAMNDAAQEVGTSIGTAVVGTLIAVLVTTTLPNGVWSHALATTFFQGEQVVFGILAVAVGLIAGLGAVTLTDSRSVDEHAAAEEQASAITARDSA